MKRLVVLLLPVVFALAGCAGQEQYHAARRYYQLRQYDEAIRQLETALRSDPRNSDYQALLVQVRRDAAREDYQRALRFYEKHQIDQALAALERANSLDPTFEDAQKAYSFIKRQKETIQAVVTEIPAKIRAGKPDDALDDLAGIEQFSSVYPQIRDLKAQALAESTVAHTKQGSLHLAGGRFEDARKEFYVALSRMPNYAPARDGIALAEANIAADKLVAQGREFSARKEYAAAYERFRSALKIVPSHKAALEAMIETGGLWARMLYDEARALQDKGGIDDLAEALRRYERAGALTERFADLDERVAAIKKALTGEFLKRGEQYEQLGEQYLGLALINYKMSLHCDPSQVAVSRKISAVKEAFDGKRAFYVDIRSADPSSAGTSFGKQLAQRLKETVLNSGITDLFVLAPYDSAAVASAASAAGLAGRRMTVFTSVLSENVITSGQNKPQIVRSRYKLGTRSVLNPDYTKAKQAQADAEAELSKATQDYQNADDVRRRATTPSEIDAAESSLEFAKRRTFDAEDRVSDARKASAATPEQIDEEIYQPYDYRVYSVTMQARIEVSLEVANPDTGAVRGLEVIAGTASAQSTYNDGVLATDAQGVSPKPPELPSEGELIDGARKDAAANAVEWFRKTLTELSRQYYQRAKALQEIGDSEGASEYFYAFYLSTPDKSSPQAEEAVEHVRKYTHLITGDELLSPRPGN